MTGKLPFTRRAALFAGAALPLLPAFSAITPRMAEARADLQGPAQGNFYRFGLGDMEVTVLLAGMAPMDKPQETYGTNATAEEFAALSRANFIPADRSLNSFSPVLVNTGTALVLFDTGLNAQAITGALAAAGQSPDQIDLVVLTHMHGDHIGGLMNEGAPTFPNARYATGRAEFDFWAGADNKGFEANVRPLEGKMSFLADGDEAAPGIRAMLTPGHTPGHMSFRIESNGKALLIAGDVVNHYVWSLMRPDWEVRFDRDKPLAAATRKKVFDLLAEERIAFSGYHMPFPAVGFVEKTADGYRYVPVSYQLMLPPK